MYSLYFSYAILTYITRATSADFTLTQSITIPTSDHDNSSSLQWALAAAASSNDSLLASSNSTSSLNDPGIQITCFSPPAWNPVVIEDFHKVVLKILVEPDAMIVRNWHLHTDPNLAFKWFSNDCGILLGAFAVSEHIYYFAPVFVSHVAALIGKQCLTEETGYLGGTANLSLLGGSAIIAVGAKRVAAMGAEIAK